MLKKVRIAGLGIASTMLMSLGFVMPATAASVPSGTVSTILGEHAGKCIGVKGSSNAAGALLQSQNCSDSGFQNWKMTKQSDNYYEIKNVASGKCLDVTGWSTVAGENLQQWDCNGLETQRWNISDQGNGIFAIISKMSGLAVEVADASTQNGGRIVQWDWMNQSHQRWSFPSNGSGGGNAGGDNPIGFGANVTGGAGGEVVTVSTPEQLRTAITGNTPRIIHVSGSIDFRRTEGFTTGLGCTNSENYCSLNGKQEKILDRMDYCVGHSKYNITYDSAGVQPLLVGSNKTIIGVGANSGIKGKGFRMVNGVSNIIIRNLSITDINDGIVWGGDGITIDNASRIWVDHNYFARIARQFIVTGWGTAQQVTISGNYLDGTTDYGHYCNRRHYWMMLFLAERQSITLAGNRIHMGSGRSPKVGANTNAQGGVVHMINNYLDQNYGSGADNMQQTTLLMEGNYFEKGTRFEPIARSATSNPLFAPTSANIGYANNYCSSILGRSCVSNVDLNNSGNFVVNSSAMSNINANSNWRNVIRSVRPKSASEVRSQRFGPQSDIQ